jgi:hypothetical protein
MDDRRGAEGIEHLQAAAREMLAAARSFLDVVEDVVEDPERLSAAATSVVDLVRGGVASATRPTSPLQPWEQAAWGDGVRDGEPAADESVQDGGERDEEPAGDGAVPDDGSLDATIDLDALAEVADAPTPRRRVRRIAVD